MKIESMTNSEDTSISDSLSTTSNSSVTSSKLNDLNASQSTSSHRKSFSSSCGQDDRGPATISLPFSVISGEKVAHVCQTTEGSLTLTNYRLFLQARDTNYNIPLGLIDQVEVREIFFLHINCKDARYLRSTFPNNETVTDVCKKIQQAISSKPIEDYFAFTFYERLEAELSEDIKQQLGFEISSFPTPKERFDAEIKRMDFNIQNPWRVSDENKDYELCGSYPTHIIVPNSIDKKKLEQVACFRSARRFPAVVWRHRGNGAVICRCSQPEVGWFGWRSAEDEELVQNILYACAFDNSPNSGETQTTQTLESLSPSNSVQNLPQSNGVQSMEVVAESPNLKKLLILDARSYTTAVANRARGGGCECLEYYPNCEIQFMNLANIHSIRKSFINLRQLCALPSDQANWFSQLESCKWLQHMSGLMKASLTVVTAIENGRPVMVHCSDGWDRTPQIVSLAEILLDPYYRSLEGFQVMVEREWFDFGHKFGDRCGQGIGSDDGNERCPVFLQWLDCLHQLIRQFPTAFEFNLSFLLKLVQHTYSNLFGTFLCNSAKERQEHEIINRTYSVWKFLRAEANSDKFRSSLYTNCDKVLWPSCEVRDLVLWSQVYLGYENPPPLLTEAINPSQESSPAPSVAAEGEMTERLASCRDTLKPARSYENLASQNHTKGLQRKLSDSSLGDSFYATQELEEESHAVTKESNIEVAESTSPVRSPSSAEFVIGSTREDDSENEEDTEPNSEGRSESTVISAYKVNLKSIESSTDTLVAENGVLLEAAAKGSGADPNKTDLNSPTSNPRTLDPKAALIANGLERKHNGVITQSQRNCGDIPETAQEHLEGHHLAKTMSHENGSDKEKLVGNTNCDVIEEYPPGLVRNGNHCEICANSKKIVGDFRENGNFPCVNLNGISQALVSTSISTSSGIGPSSSESKYSSYNTPIHSRTPSTGVPATPCCEDVGGIANLSCSGKQERYNIDVGGRPSFDVDGLTSYHDEVQNRVNTITSAYRSRIDTLEKELHVTKLALMYQISHRCAHRSVDRPDDIVSNADSACSGEHHSVGHESHASDLSWEAVDENDTMPTRWVPDYAAKECMNCDHPFWFASRKHHCRSCGKIFCAECSEKSIPLPNEQIFQPVRVCKACFAKHTPQTTNAAADANSSAPLANGISSAAHSNKTTAHQNGRADLTTTSVPCNTTTDNSQAQHHAAAVASNLPATHAKIKKPLRGNDVEHCRNGH